MVFFSTNIFLFLILAPQNTQFTFQKLTLLCLNYIIFKSFFYFPLNIFILDVLICFTYHNKKSTSTHVKVPFRSYNIDISSFSYLHPPAAPPKSPTETAPQSDSNTIQWYHQSFPRPYWCVTPLKL